MRWGEIRQKEDADDKKPSAKDKTIRKITSFGHVHISVKSTISRQWVGIGPSACGDHPFHTAKAKQAQPARKANPPSGVIAPSHFSPVQLNR